MISPEQLARIAKAREPKGAVFSPSRTYRYILWRVLDESNPKTCVFIGLNPSTADENVDDPTIRRCANYARDWGYGRLEMLNLFAFRATDPNEMKQVAEPIGPDNDSIIAASLMVADMAVAAWGNHGTHKDRAAQVMMIYSRRLHYLRLTKSGQPSHLLYLPKTLTPCPFST